MSLREEIEKEIQAKLLEGGSGYRVTVEIPDDDARRFIVPYSPGEVMGRWREFCIPAEIVNRYPVSTYI